MTRWRMYIDESGDHHMSALESPDPQRRYLSLTGVWVAREERIGKRTYFRFDADEPLVLHRKDLIAQRGKFAPLRDTTTREKSRKHPIARVLETTPGLGPIRVARLLPWSPRTASAPDSSSGATTASGSDR